MSGSGSASAGTGPLAAGSATAAARPMAGEPAAGGGQSAPAGGGRSVGEARTLPAPLAAARNEVARCTASVMPSGALPWRRGIAQSAGGATGRGVAAASVNQSCASTPSSRSSSCSASAHTDSSKARAKCTPTCSACPATRTFSSAWPRSPSR